jgi:hypothetical protein
MIPPDRWLLGASLAGTLAHGEAQADTAALVLHCLPPLASLPPARATCHQEASKTPAGSQRAESR